MPKMKSHRGASKRFKLTSKGKVKRGHPGHGHYLTQKSTKRKRGLRRSSLVSPAFARKIREMIK